MNRRSLELKGILFEAQIGRVIEKNFPGSYNIFDKTLYSPYLGRTTSIDLITVTDSAIFVVEAKNWAEYIKGNINDDKWVGRGSSSSTLSVVSPFLQNDMHIRALTDSALRKGVRLPEMISVICLPDSAIIETDCDNVVNLSKLPQFIFKSSLSKNKIPVIDTVRTIKTLE